MEVILVAGGGYMKRSILKPSLLGIFGVLASISIGYANTNLIDIVGSSTVYPFTAKAAEQFQLAHQNVEIKVESTGTGGGMKLFCKGAGVDTPSITGASRAIKKSEVQLCADNGVSPIELKVGYDGIVMASSDTNHDYTLSLRDVFLALAKQVPADKNGSGGKLIANPYTYWDQIDSALPHTKIKVLGPPPTSGTRDAFAELALEGGCKTYPDLLALKQKDKNQYKVICQSVREDGSWVSMGENDNLIIAKLKADPNAIGVFGYSFMDQNRQAVQAIAIRTQQGEPGVKPEFENIASGAYPISRSLYLYVKKQHIKEFDNLANFVRYYMSSDQIGEEGSLTEIGLIPISHTQLHTMQNAISQDLTG